MINKIYCGGCGKEFEGYEKKRDVARGYKRYCTKECKPRLTTEQKQKNKKELFKRWKEKNKEEYMRKKLEGGRLAYAKKKYGDFSECFTILLEIEKEIKCKN